MGSVRVGRPGFDSVGVKVGVDHGVEQVAEVAHAVAHGEGAGVAIVGRHAVAHGANPKSIAGDTEKPAPRRRRGCW